MASPIPRKGAKVPPLDEILIKVTKPARYTGGEWNAVVKDWDLASVRLALAYPDLYEIGMSNLGLAILYELINRQPDFLAERVFAPWPDMEAEMRSAGLPLFSLETRRPLRDFDVVGFSLGYELTYTNVLNMLDLAGIPLLAQERSQGHPLIVAGGSCALNPEPMADFIDLFVVGEGEEVILELLDLVRLWKEEGGDKTSLLRAAASIDGVYVPQFYRADYHPDGRLAHLEPTVAEAKAVVKRRIVDPLPPPLTRPIVPYIEVIHDRAALEVQRGCTHGCRFCQAGIIYRPLRQRGMSEVIAASDELLKNTGYSELSLLSLSSADYPQVEELVAELYERHGGNGFTLSLPSLRMESFCPALADALPGKRRGGFTFAPEAGTERLRRAINKGASDQDLLQAAEVVFSRGWSNLKLYFMIGLPGESDDDIDAISHLARSILQVGRNHLRGRAQVRVSAATFIPKAHTPFQWVAQDGEDELEAKHQRLRLGLRRARVPLSWQDPKVSLLEAVMARGDRRLGAAIKRAWELGATFDAWSEHFRIERWLEAFSDTGLDPSFYAHRERPLDELLPWAHIDTGVAQAFLRREYQRFKAGKETPDCRSGPCSACGLQEGAEACAAKYAQLLSTS